LFAQPVTDKGSGKKANNKKEEDAYFLQAKVTHGTVFLRVNKSYGKGRYIPGKPIR
jgi:hypothetical protein